MSSLLVIIYHYCMAAKNHYEQITNLYNASQNLWNAVNTITSISKEAYSYIYSIYTNSKKLMYNAYRYGISENVSNDYYNNIQNLADSFAAAAYKNIEVSQAAAGPMRQLQAALSDYTPETIKAALKPKQAPPQTPEKQPDVKIEEPQPQENKQLSTEDVIKNVLNRDIINFYSVPKYQYDNNKAAYDKAGYQLIPGLGLIAPDQVSIAKKIINEKWIKSPQFGYLSPQEYNMLKLKGIPV